MFCVGGTQTHHTNQTWTIPSTAPQPGAGHKGLAQTQHAEPPLIPTRRRSPFWRGMGLTAHTQGGLQEGE